MVIPRTDELSSIAIRGVAIVGQDDISARRQGIALPKPGRAFAMDRAVSRGTHRNVAPGGGFRTRKCSAREIGVKGHNKGQQRVEKALRTRTRVIRFEIETPERGQCGALSSSGNEELGRNGRFRAESTSSTG